MSGTGSDCRDREASKQNAKTDREQDRERRVEGWSAQQIQLKGATQTTSRVSNLFRQINHTIERQKMK